MEATGRAQAGSRQALRPHELVTLAALARSVCRTDEQPIPGAGAGAVASAAAELLAAGSPAARRNVRALLSLCEWIGVAGIALPFAGAAAGLALGGLLGACLGAAVLLWAPFAVAPAFGRFSTRSRTAQDRILGAYAESSLYAVRARCREVASLLVVSFYSLPAVRRALGLEAAQGARPSAAGGEAVPTWPARS